MATINDLPFTLEELNDAVKEGLVTARPHATLPYEIYNYSDAVQFSRAWNKVTLGCRGLILDDHGHVVARPWNKFFNLGEVNLPIQFDERVEVMDKMDGSLGILYRTLGGNYAVSTRGSFHSEQAEHATEVFQAKYADSSLNRALDQSGMTFLFEIIYRSNRIVLDYGDTDDLVLLGCVQNATGYYYGPREAAAFINWLGPVVKVFDHASISDALSDTERDNAEGFVIRSHNFLVKVKQPDYIELHRLRFNMTPKRIWEAMSAGNDLQTIVEPLPDEFQDEILSIGRGIRDQYTAIAIEIANEWLHTEGHRQDRPTYAKVVKGMKHTGALFSMLDGRTDAVESYIWKLIKPNGDK